MTREPRKEFFGPISFLSQTAAVLAYWMTQNGWLEGRFGSASIVFIVVFALLAYLCAGIAVGTALVGWFRRELNPWLPLVVPVLVAAVHWKFNA